MQLETFRGKDMKDALSAMRANLGEDAVILSSEKVGDGSILVCAAPGTKKEEAPQKPATIASFETRYRDRLLAKLRGKHDPQTIRIDTISRPDLLVQLRAHRLPEALAHALAEAAEASGFADPALALASALDKRMKVMPVAVHREHVILLAGPHGSGKTAVAAKLAAEAVLTGRKVRLAATDLSTAGQRERLETFAVHLDVPVIDASRPGLLVEAAAEARRENAFLVVDTSGFDPATPPHEIMLATRMGSAETIGVVSATMDAEEASDAAASLAKLGAKRLVISCFDLARRKGATATLACSGLPIAHVTASPYLVEGLDSLTPPALARALLCPLVGSTLGGMNS
jgi:flagellar biosynthesis protein FlhF